MTDLQVDVIADEAALGAIAPEWDALVRRAGIDHPFLSHDWVRTWWQCFGAGCELYVLAVRSGGALIGLAPLMRTRRRMYGLPIRRIEFMANVHTPRFDFVLAERAEEACRAILDHLRQHAPAWDIVVLPELAEHSRTAAALTQLARARSLSSGLWIADASPRIPVAGTFEAYWAKLSSNRRGQMRKRLRQLEGLGAVTLEVVTGGEQLAAALHDGMRIEAASWKGDAGTAISLNPDLTRFYLQVAECAARAGSLNLLFLKSGARRVAFAYCLRYEGTLYLLKTGYDPEYARYSPFNLLMVLSIEWAFRNGVATFDLLGSEEPWKLAWTKERTQRHWLFLYARTWRAFAIYVVKVWLSPWRKRVLARSFTAEHGAETLPSPTPKLLRAQR